MTAIAERKALERLSQSWRKLIAGAKSPPSAAPPEQASPATETPVLPPAGGPGAPSTPAG